MSDEKINRRDVDKLATQILINLGLLNGAALAAAVNHVDGFSVRPFAIGLICAIFSQLWWYADAALEHALKDKEYAATAFEEFSSLIVSLFILVGACLSAAFLVVGCLQLLEVSHASLWGVAICVTPFLAMVFFFVKISKRV